MSKLIPEREENNFNSHTRLHLEKDGEAVKDLILAGEDVNAVDYLKWTPLHHPKDKEAIKALIQAGADVNAKNYFDETPLFCHKCKDKVKVLILAGADVNIEGKFNRSPLDIPFVKEVYDEIVDAQKLLSHFVKRNFRYFVFKHWIKSREGVEWLYHPKRGGKYIQRFMLLDIVKI